MQLLSFRLDDLRFALHIESVDRVLRAVEITPLADAPRNVLGLINVYGHIIPVFDLRRRLGLPAREIDPSDQLIIAQAGGRALALPVDEIGGVEDCAVERETPAAEILPGQEQMDGIARLEGGMAFIEDLDRLCAQTVAQVAGTGREGD